MSIYKELNKNPTKRDLLEFGLIFGVGMGIIGALNHFAVQVLFFKGNPSAALPFWIAGAAIFVLALIPPIGRLLYILWMALGLTIGFFTAPIVMFVVYVIAIVPLGFIFKLMRRDTMRRELDPNAKSYWEEYPKTDDPASYVRQF
ncbi:MAG: SxtJ family membrane protein [Minicystis sp.]